MPSSHMLAIRRPRTRSSLSALALLLPLALPGVALANGFEYSTPGARGMGRGDADIAGTDNPMAIYFNPANLARITHARLLAGTNVTNANICVQRELIDEDPGTAGLQYAPTAEANAATLVNGRWLLPQVCDRSQPTINPNGALAIPIAPGLVIAGGLFTPVGTQYTTFGLRDGTTNVNGTSIPTPTRYLLTDQNILQTFPTIAVGYAVNDYLRLGLAFGAGSTVIKYNSYAFTTLGIDVRNHIDAVDAFVPRVTASIASTLFRRLDLGATFTWTDDIKAGTSRLDLAAAGLGSIATINGVRLISQQNWWIGFGGRYAHPLRGGPVDNVGDRMSRERWDAELDVVVTGNQRVSSFIVDMPNGTTVLGMPLPDPLTLPHNWHNQTTVRLGGDFNALPGIFAVRGGLSYDSNGVDKGFQQVDFLPFQRFGLHIGATVRIAHRFDINAGYSHFFVDTADNLGSNCAPGGVPQNPPRCIERPSSSPTPSAQERAIANAGRISANMNIFGIEFAYTFGTTKNVASAEVPVESDELPSTQQDIPSEMPPSGDIPPVEPSAPVDQPEPPQY